MLKAPSQAQGRKNGQLIGSGVPNPIDVENILTVIDITNTRRNF